LPATASGEEQLREGSAASVRDHIWRPTVVRQGSEPPQTGLEIVAVLGHHRLAMVELYTEDANRKKLADSG
jgi:hypothetical protein